MIKSFERAKEFIGKPIVIISYLIKGADVSFMQHTKKFHGRAPKKQEYENALKELENIERKLV